MPLLDRAFAGSWDGPPPGQTTARFATCGATRAAPAILTIDVSAGQAWSRRSGSNRRPTAYKAVALPLSYTGVAVIVRGTVIRESGAGPLLPVGSQAMADFVVVANRLPVDMETLPDGTTEWRASPGGLVTALAPMLRGRGGAWVGWPGVADAGPEPFEDDGLDLHPVALSAQDVEDYYEGFSNGTLWPLYHDVVRAAGVPPALVAGLRQGQRAVRRRRRRGGRPGRHRLGARLPAPARPGRCCASGAPTCASASSCTSRSRRPSCSCSSPGASEIIEGLLGADLVGFHTAGRRRNFRALATPPHRRRAASAAASCATTAAPSGSAPSRSPSTPARSTSSPAPPRSSDRAKAIRAELGDPEHLLLGVDRLDYTKGIDVRLRAFEELLDEGRAERHRDGPDRDAEPRARRALPAAARASVEQAVGRINGEYAQRRRTRCCTTCTSRCRATQLVALYAAADVMLVTPLRDGMNLVAKEYVASRARPRRRARALRVHRRRDGAEGRAAGQPARHRRAEGGHRQPRSTCRAPRAANGCGPCDVRCSPTTSTAGPTASSTRSASRNDRRLGGWRPHRSCWSPWISTARSRRSSPCPPTPAPCPRRSPRSTGWPRCRPRP